LAIHLHSSAADGSSVSDQGRPGELEAKYANTVNIAFNLAEFIFEFSQSYSDRESPVVVVRVVTAPVNARAFGQVLDEALRRYEEAVGPIPEH
jgi:uncharacterized protein DUF3467